MSVSAGDAGALATADPVRAVAPVFTARGLTLTHELPSGRHRRFCTLAVGSLGCAGQPLLI